MIKTTILSILLFFASNPLIASSGAQTTSWPGYAQLFQPVTTHAIRNNLWTSFLDRATFRHPLNQDELKILELLASDGLTQQSKNLTLEGLNASAYKDMQPQELTDIIRNAPLLPEPLLLTNPQ